MRARRPRTLDSLMSQYADHMVADPFAHLGKWRQDFMPHATEVRLDLGCGKGGFLIQAAQQEPDVLFVGIDNNDICILNTARSVKESGVPNVCVVLADADHISRIFAPAELDRIYLNFNAPFPKKKYAAKRLTHLDRLMEYRLLLGEAGLLDLRTDNMPYWKFSLDELSCAGYRILAQTEDLHALSGGGSPSCENGPSCGGSPSGGIGPSCAGSPFAQEPIVRSEYDQRLVEKGAVVYALRAQPGPAPKNPRQTAKLGLIEYLPEDLSTLDRIPYGMEDTVRNMTNRKINAQRRAAEADSARGR